MEYLRGELYAIAGLMDVEGHTLNLLASGGSPGVFVDFGYRRRVRVGQDMYLVHWEPDGTARWEPIDAGRHMEEDRKGSRVFKLAAYLKSKGYKCVCHNDVSMEDYIHNCAHTLDIILGCSGHLYMEHMWLDYSGYRWSVDYHRPGQLTVDGRDVKWISTSFWLTRNLLRDQETRDALLGTFEKPAHFTRAEFVRWLTDLGMGEFLHWIEVHFRDGDGPEQQAVSEWMGEYGCAVGEDVVK